MKYATVGTSWITESLIESAKHVDDFELYAVYSRSADKGKAFAGKHGASLYFDDLDEMLGCDEIDAVYIASPNKFHFEQSLKCLEAGKHVLCEKPAVVYPEQLDILIETAERKGLVYLEAIKSLHADSLPLLKNAIAQCGNIRTANIDFSQLSSKYRALKNGELPNIFNPDLCTGGLMDLGVYNIYVAVELFGEPESIVSKCSFLETGADYAGTAVLVYPDKSVTVTYSKVGQSYAPSQFFGDEGTVSVKSVSKLIGIYKHTKDSVETVYPDVDENLIMSMEVRDFVNYIKNGKDESYKYCCDTAKTVCRIMQTIRKQNNFKF